MPNINKSFVVQFPCFQKDHQVSSTGKGPPLAGLCAQHSEHFMQSLRGNYLVGRNEGPHNARLPFLHASSTAWKIFMYPVQRQRLPARPSRISASVGCGFLSRRLTAAITI